MLGGIVSSSEPDSRRFCSRHCHRRDHYRVSRNLAKHRVLPLARTATNFDETYWARKRSWPVMSRFHCDINIQSLPRSTISQTSKHPSDYGWINEGNLLRVPAKVCASG